MSGAYGRHPMPARYEVAEGQPDPPFEPGRSYPSCAPELASSLLSYRAGFVHVALASLFARDDRDTGPTASPEDRASCREWLPALVDAYERAHGPIRRSYFARHAFAAAAITDNDELDIVWGTQESLRNPPLVALLMRCQQLSYGAWHRLSDFDRRFCQDMIFSVAVECLRRMDREATAASNGNASAGGNGNGSSATVEATGSADAEDQLSKELDGAEDFMLRCAGRRTQIRYTKGMVLGLLPTLALIGLLVGALLVADVDGQLITEIALVMGAGATGAVVSVLVRMTFGRFNMNLPTLDHDMRTTDLRIVGGMRPLIGAVFGFMVYAFIQAALVPIEPQGDGPDTFLYIATGFLAGFSERLAQDMFARSGQGLFGAVGDAPTSGPAAGLSPPPGGRSAAL